MRISNPHEWILQRLHTSRSFLAIRFNDGEHVMMYQTMPEGKIIGTDISPVPVHYQLGAELRSILPQIAGKTNVLIGCSWNTERADTMGRGPFAQDVQIFGLENANWCNEHWPLDGVVDGRTIELIDAIRECNKTVLVTNESLLGARYCLNAKTILAPPGDSYRATHSIYQQCTPLAEQEYLFVWAAGVGLKPTMNRLWQEFPHSSHIDIGHLFNGAFGLQDYGWLIRRDGPWYRPYMDSFVPYVQSHIPEPQDKGQ